jgi:hypothetical protein
MARYENEGCLMELAAEADALSLGLDAANAIKARNSIEQMLMHQAAAAHKLAMRFMAKADHRLSQVVQAGTHWAAASRATRAQYNPQGTPDAAA